ncbi:37S ribosomal protein [Grosmannia clavigera kw1407]|uniref:37S ribosomal protein n=1 Tax=Grosmannia clavigera (strain kw1407 / UAMH 11150) TaxID=655863 RepID=F0XSK6_GROCL|nr:37S ribosomal protein [Grosmannia clavigera kw1407]EFW99327.1 37S ribosomal protein [Grosmannia clavigera kw1407]
MASTVQSLQLCVRRCCAGAAARRGGARAGIRTTTSAAAAAIVGARQLSSTSGRRYAREGGDGGGDGAGGKDQALEPWEVELMAKEAASERIMTISEALRATLTAEQRAGLAEAKGAGTEQEARLLVEMRREFALGRRGTPRKRNTFWNEEEPDGELITDEVGEDEFRGDDITSMAHGKLDELRERRHYARLAAWEMPLLSKLAKPFEPPTADMPLRFRFTSYLGEFHPAEKKVVVEFCPADLGLTDVQQRKLTKLVGARYNPETEIVRMSCEQFEHQAQNKRYLGDLVEKLVAEAKDPADTLEDIPLDTRHHTFKTKPKFPKAWRLTEERRQQLQALRAQAFLADQQKMAQGTLVDGAQRVAASLAAPAASDSPLADKVAELVRARR